MRPEKHLLSSEICDAYRRFQTVVPDIVEQISQYDAHFALMAIKAFDGQSLSAKERYFVISRLSEKGEPLAFGFNKYLKSMDYPADIIVLESSDIAERLLTSGFEKEHYDAVLEGRMGVGGGRGRDIDINSLYRWHPMVRSSGHYF